MQERNKEVFNKKVLKKRSSKVTAAVLALSMIASLGACGKEEKKESSSGKFIIVEREAESSSAKDSSAESSAVSPDTTTGAPEDTTTPAANDTTTPEPIDTGTPAPSGTATPTDTPTPEVSETPTPEPTKSGDSGQTAPSDYKAPDLSGATKDEIKLIKGIYVLRDTGYEAYTYLENVAVSYADTVNAAAKKFPGVNVVNTVIPLSSGITFPEHLRGNISSSNQKTSLEKIQAKISSDVKFVNIFDTMNAHRDEYIYYRTDHHWTGRGAYYAYAEIMKALGKTTKNLSDYTVKRYDGFYGSFWNDTKSAQLETNPDYVECYDSGASTSLTFTQTDGQTLAWPLFNDVTKYGKTLKYCAYAAGDNPYTVIKNKGLSDGSACIVVKESFGNAFVPYLVDHYQTIYEVDYRYYKKSFAELVKTTGATEIYIINNIGMTRSALLVGKLKACLVS